MQGRKIWKDGNREYKIHVLCVTVRVNTWERYTSINHLQVGLICLIDIAGGTGRHSRLESHDFIMVNTVGSDKGQPKAERKSGETHDGKAN